MNNEIHFGFINTPYQSTTVRRAISAAKEESKRARRRSFRSTKTAEDVSVFLEDKYGIIDIFYELHEDDIIGLINDIVTDRLERVLEGTLKLSDTSFARIAKPAFPQIEKMFREFLDRREMDGNVPGVPTKASILGLSKWYKHKRPNRASFIDTGIYRASFRCWGE